MRAATAPFPPLAMPDAFQVKQVLFKLVQDVTRPPTAAPPVVVVVSWTEWLGWRHVACCRGHGEVRRSHVHSSQTRRWWCLSGEWRRWQVGRCHVVSLWRWGQVQGGRRVVSSTAASAHSSTAAAVRGVAS